MEIVDFTKEYTAEARRLAAENYEEERGYVRVLPEKNEIPLERELTANGLGTAIVENGRHLGESPCFIMMDEASIAEWQQRKESSGVRIFTAWSGKEPVAYLEITDEGENFITDAREMQNICGAYCVPAYRGKGIMQQLVNHAMGVLRAEGYTKLGVDYESINPTAWGFWNKYFPAYTYSLTRRIVESAYREDSRAEKKVAK